eukprot:582642-Rhodomonas_salina.4
MVWVASSGENGENPRRKVETQTDGRGLTLEPATTDSIASTLFCCIFRPSRSLSWAPREAVTTAPNITPRCSKNKDQ